MMLSEMTQNELQHEFAHGSFPKWSSICFLKSLNLNVLNAAFIKPSYTQSQATAAIKKFCSLQKLDRVLLRTDGGVEIGDYIRAGNSMPINLAIEYVSRMRRLGRAVVLMCPTNRFTNRLSINLLLDSRRGEFCVELLGPGFDVSDLNRGVVPPEHSLHALFVDWNTFEYPSPALISRRDGPISLDEARQIRLSRIGSELLPAAGLVENQLTPEEAKTWLEGKGYNALFEGHRISFHYRDLKRLYEVAFQIGISYRESCQWDILVVSASVLSKLPDIFFWEVVNARKKFGIVG